MIYQRIDYELIQSKSQQIFLLIGYLMLLLLILVNREFFIVFVVPNLDMKNVTLVI